MLVERDAGIDFVEVFPIPPGAAPTLTGYEMLVGGQVSQLVGGKLSYRLGKQFPGHWVWTAGRIVTDAPQDDNAIKTVVEALWREQAGTYKDLRGVRHDPGWRPTARARADFVARGLFRDIDRDIRRLLESHRRDLGAARVERVYEVRGWVIDGRSAVSLSVASRLVLKQDLAEYAKKVTDAGEVVGLWVGDKRSTGKGEVIEIVGRLGEHRTRLLSISQEEDTQELLQSAPDDELVVRVALGRNEYDYTASALRIILRTTEFPKFGVDAAAAARTLRLEPSTRASIVSAVANLAKGRGFIGDGYNSRSHAHLFLHPDNLSFRPALSFGGGATQEYREADLWRNLRRYGLYKPSSLYKGHRVRVGVLRGMGANESKVPNLLSQLGELGVTAEVTSSLGIADLSRASLEKAIGDLLPGEPDIVLAILPEDVGEDEEEWGAYHNFKSVTVARGIPSQVVYEGTLARRHAFANIAMGILAKTGSVPFVLAEPLPYTDMVVGLDIARERKRQLAGSLNATAVARIYFGNGDFLRYVIHDAPLEGETIPGHVLQGLFPLQEFRGKRVVIHRDGYFRGDEKQVLQKWAKDIGAEFSLVEVIKTGTPRAYRTENKSITQPEKGLLFRLNDHEAFLVSSLPPFKNATPQPLQIRTEPPFTIEKAAHSVLSMTLLHYGSLRPPRLPVTIHYSDRIAYLALRGIKPRELEGTIPYWL